MKIKKHLFISIIVLLVLGTNVYMTVTTTTWVKQLKTDSLQNISNDELIAIKGIIEENYDKAQAQADSVKNSAEQSILSTYTNKNQLASDLSSVGDKTVYHILQDSITNKYLNVKNDNNDMFVWIPNIGKVADTSLNCAFQKGESVSIEGEIAKQNDKTLARIALNSMINQENKKWRFWNYLPTPDGFYQPQTMDESEIDKLYSMYGYKGLQYLEFLTPSYLRQNEDITGTPDVDQNGVKTDNEKIIFVQGFNIVDDLESQHKDLLQHYTDLTTYTTDKYDSIILAIGALGIVIFVVLLIGFMSIVRDANKT